MSNSYVNQFPIESFSLNTIQLTVLIAGLIEFVLLNLLLDTKRVYTFFSRFQSQLTSSDDCKDQAGVKDETSTKRETRADQSVREGDVEIVLRRLGMLDNCAACLDSNEIFDIFEEENIGLNEVKEAFDVFDDNGDGFIDAKELQKVLYALGLKEGSEMENCRRMIAVFDENGDGRIDFDEFVKLTEMSFN